MHEETLILTQTRASFIERLDPRAKLLALLVWVICLVSTGPRPWKLLSCYAAMFALLLAGNPRILARFTRRFLPPLPAIGVVALLLPLAREGQPLWQSGWLKITQEGIELGLRFAAVATLCLAGVALVWASTRQELLLSGLRGLGMPAVFAEILGFMLRYLEVLRPELHRLTDAQAARSIGPGGPGRLQSAANVAGTLFLRAYDRAEQVAQAMAARGYSGRPWTLRRLHFHGRDILAAGGFATLVVSLRLLVGTVI